MEPYFISDFPKLMLDWSYELNPYLNPASISYGSDKFVVWKCHECSSTWRARVKTRNKGNGTGCPICWKRNRIGRNVYVGSARDGNNIADKFPNLLKEWDYKKNLNIDPRTIMPNSNKMVWWICKDCGGSWESNVVGRTRGTGCPYCSGHKVRTGVNDLKTMFPGLAEEWDYDNNGKLRPENVLPFGNKRINWICKTCGGKWDAILHSRAKGAGCPYCSGRRVMKGINDLATVRPDLIQEWNFVKNGDLLPETVSARSKRSVGWKCLKCGYEWTAAISSRVDGTGCRVCKRRGGG